MPPFGSEVVKKGLVHTAPWAADSAATSKPPGTTARMRFLILPMPLLFISTIILFMLFLSVDRLLADVSWLVTNWKRVIGQCAEIGETPPPFDRACQDRCLRHLSRRRSCKGRGQC